MPLYNPVFQRLSQYQHGIDGAHLNILKWLFFTMYDDNSMYCIWGWWTQAWVVCTTISPLFWRSASILSTRKAKHWLCSYCAGALSLFLSLSLSLFLSLSECSIIVAFSIFQFCCVWVRSVHWLDTSEEVVMNRI